MAPTHTDFSEFVIEHFKDTGKLPQKVSALEPDLVRELIDAIPDSMTKLVAELKDLLRREGERDA